MRYRLHHFARDDRGAVAIEVALVLPLFLVMIFGIAVIGYLTAVSSSLQQLAADASRASVAGLNTAERQSLALAALADGIDRHPLLDPARITRQVVQPTTPFPGMQVTLTYNLQGTLVTVAEGLVDLGLTSIQRRAFLAY